VFGLVGILIVVAAGSYVYMSQLEKITPDGTTPKTMISATGVRNDLLAIANAERRYSVTNAKYASFDELRNNGDIQVPARADYTYSADANDSHFTITATYTGSDPHAPKRITLDDTMTITSN